MELAVPGREKGKSEKCGAQLFRHVKTRALASTFLYDPRFLGGIGV